MSARLTPLDIHQSLSKYLNGAIYGLSSHGRMERRIQACECEHGCRGIVPCRRSRTSGAGYAHGDDEQAGSLPTLSISGIAAGDAAGVCPPAGGCSFWSTHEHSGLIFSVWLSEDPPMEEAGVVEVCLGPSLPSASWRSFICLPAMVYAQAFSRSARPLMGNGFRFARCSRAIDHLSPTIHPGGTRLPASCFRAFFFARGPNIMRRWMKLP